MYDRTQWFSVPAGAIGGAFAVAGKEALSVRTAFPLVAIPFATSIVTVLGSPQAEPAQPRALIGGHLVATFIGLLIVKLFGPVPWAAALAVGKEAATDAARAKLRRFANRAFRSGLLSRTVETARSAAPGAS